MPAAPEAVPVPSARGGARQAIDSDCDVLSAPVAEPYSQNATAANPTPVMTIVYGNAMTTMRK